MMDEKELQRCFESAVELAKKGGEMIRNAFGKAKKIESKGYSTDLVTETDQQVEKMILGTLKERFPTHKYDIYLSVCHMFVFVLSAASLVRNLLLLASRAR
jgi:3'-phosphoadenosine 5'-phosphosulfate (PAPS) 3'-phosphatase